MTLRLILMRHAKSDWNTPSSGDFERPLNDRGRQNATQIGVWLRECGHIPDQILCSAAARTRETLSLVLAEIGSSPIVGFSNNLYLASPEAMFQTLLSAKTGQVTMMLAHNPGSAILASALVKSRPDHSRFQDYPTAATTVIDFEIDQWADLAPESGTILDFVTPKDLLP